MQVAIAGALIFRHRGAVIGLGDIIGEIVGDVVEEAGRIAVKTVHRKWGFIGCALALLGTVATVGVMIWAIVR